MAKTTAPLLSFGARGTIAKTQVYANWRGIAYARRYAIPSNPQSAEQTKTRSTFSWLQAVFKLLAPNVQSAWVAAAKGRPLTDRNLFAKDNLAHLRGTTLAPVTVITALESSPGANGGFSPASMTPTDSGTHHITVTMVRPDVPDGWAVVMGHAIAIKQQNAKTGTDYASVYGNDDSDPEVIVLDMVIAGTYVASGFYEFTKPDGTTAYGPSMTAEIIVA